jgi:2-iminoacetate synthase ThiH
MRGVQDRLEMMPLAELMEEAAALRDQAHGRVVTYSRKVFIPLTKLCRDVCHYCTFAEKPRAGHGAYLSPDEVLARRSGSAGRTRLRHHHRLPDRHVRAGAEGNQPAAAR